MIGEWCKSFIIYRHLYDVPEMQVVENDEVSDVDEEFGTYDCNTKIQISERTSLHKEDIVANTINCEIVDNVNVLIDSDQESGDDNGGMKLSLMNMILTLNIFCSYYVSI
ncbi:hypothetical protein V6N13_149051 [Hibiscus sabdariffa]